MQFVGQGDIVAKAILLFLSVMLFASMYLFLIKAVGLSWRAYRARQFLGGLAKADSLQQVQALVDQQATIESFSRVSHCILLEKKRSQAMNSRQREAANGGEVVAMAKHSIALEAAEQAKQLKQGLSVLATMVWVAPLAGLAATAWRAVWLWLQSAQAQWPQGLVLLQFGLMVGLVSLLAYLALRLGNRAYLSKFALYAQLMMPMLDHSSLAMGTGAKPQYDFRQMWRTDLDAIGM